MELNLKLTNTNSYPIGGLLINSSSVEVWLKELEVMELKLQEIELYGIPDVQLNSVWGCLVLFDRNKVPKNIGKNTYCQRIKTNLFIPENTTLYPNLSDLELNTFFSENIHLFHPVFGLVKLEEKLIWKNLLSEAIKSKTSVTKPYKSVFIPNKIQSFKIHELPIDEVLKNFEENTFPEKEDFKDKPLSLLEKLKLTLLRTSFKNDPFCLEKSPEESNLLKKLNSLFPSKDFNWLKKLQKDYEELEKRNQSEINKLLELFKNNPEEALKYSFPIDNQGVSRGKPQNIMPFKLSKRWNNFSLFNNPVARGSGASLLNDLQYSQLQMQYYNTAKELVKNNKHQKAAFIYMKLLKNYYLAAQTLENGNLFPEAASVYLKYLNNKEKAAECYEKGKMFNQAIELYKELNQDEKVGDLYLLINQKEKAYQYLQRVVEQYIANYQYVKASLIYKNKMDMLEKAQELLIKGWDNGIDSFNCLNNYFYNIENEKKLEESIKEVYNQKTNKYNKEIFLQVIKYEYEKQTKLQAKIKDMAYELIAEIIPFNSSIVSELRVFNKEDNNLIKDIMKYKQKK